MRELFRTMGLVLLSVAISAGVCWLAWQRSPNRKPSSHANQPLREMEAATRRIMIREAIASQVARKEITLFEAAAWYRRLNEEAGHRKLALWTQMPGSCEGEKACRQVLLWMRTRMRMLKRPEEEIEATVRALEKELDDHIGRHGKVVLEDGR